MNPETLREKLVSKFNQIAVDYATRKSDIPPSSEALAEAAATMIMAEPDAWGCICGRVDPALYVRINSVITDEQIEEEAERRYRWVNSGDPSRLDSANDFEAGARWALEMMTER